MFTLTLDDFREVRARIAPHIKHTPLLTSRQLSELTGFEVRLKAEMFQRVGSYKIRGPLNKFALMPEEQKARGVVCSSAGNHAQGVALAAKIHGIRAVVCMAENATPAKIAATRGYGAEVVLYDRIGDESREAIAQRIQDEQGAVLVPPFDDDAVIAGQGTLGLELLEDVPDLDVIVTPCGGGGLLSGTAVAARGIRPGIRLWGVEPEAGDDMKRSLEKGEPVTIPLPATIADALQTTRPAERTLAIVRALTEGILTVSDLELRRAMALLASRLKLVVEPGGSAAFAALLHGKVPDVAGRRIGIILSGGNVDPDRFGALISGVE
jgi:threonine dehydratase